MLQAATKQAIDLAKKSPLVCRSCHQEAIHNETLRISFCRVHGLSSPLEALRGADQRIGVRASLYVRHASPDLERGSWAVPAG